MRSEITGEICKVRFGGEIDDAEAVTDSPVV